MNLRQIELTSCLAIIILSGCVNTEGKLSERKTKIFNNENVNIPVEVNSLCIGSQHYREKTELSEIGFPEYFDIIGANRSAELVDQWISDFFHSQNILLLSTAGNPVTKKAVLAQNTEFLNSAYNTESESFNIVYVCGHGTTSLYDNTPYLVPGNSDFIHLLSNGNKSVEVFQNIPSVNLIDITEYLLLADSFPNSKWLILADFCQDYYDESNSYHPDTLAKEVLSEYVPLFEEQAIEALDSSLKENYHEIAKYLGVELDENFEESKEYRRELEAIKQEIPDFMDQHVGKVMDRMSMADIIDTIVHVKKNILLNIPIIVSSKSGYVQRTAPDPTVELSSDIMKMSRIGPLGRRLFLALKKLDNEDVVTLGELVDMISSDSLDKEVTETPVVYWNRINSELILRKKNSKELSL